MAQEKQFTVTVSKLWHLEAEACPITVDGRTVTAQEILEHIPTRHRVPSQQVRVAIRMGRLAVEVL